MSQFGRARWLGSFVVIALIGWLGTYEVGRIIGDVPIDGVTHPPDVLHSVLALRGADGTFAAWAQAAASGLDLRRWLQWFEAFDLLLIAGYTGALLSASLRWNLRIRAWAGALAAVDVLENVIGFVAIAQIPGACTAQCGAAGPPLQLSWGAAGALSVLIVLKTALAAVVIVRIGYSLVSSPDLRAAARLTGRALGVQRFPLLVVIVLGGLLLIPGSPILEQGVDVERSWLMTDNYVTGAQFMVLAVLAMIALALALGYLAGVLVAPVDGLRDDEDEPEAVTRARAVVDDLRSGILEFWPVWRGTPYWGYAWTILRAWCSAFGATLLRSWRWLAAAAAYVAIAGILDLASAAQVHWPQIWVVAGVIAAIPVVSAALALIKAGGTSTPRDADVRRHALKVGRVLAASVVVIVLVSVVRAYIAPPMLEQWEVTSRVVLPTAAVLAVALTFWILSGSPRVRLLDDPLDAGPPATQRRLWNPGSTWSPQSVGTRTATVHNADAAPPRVAGLRRRLPAAAVAVVVVPALLLLPMTIARNAGVMAVIALCLLGVSAVYGVLMLLAQLIDPPHIFRLMRMRRTPVIGLVVIMSVVSTLVGGGTALHSIRERDAGGTAARATLQEALGSWLAADRSDCAIAAPAVPGGPQVSVRPLIMVAAEGGGVRAAWWTVDAMTALTSSDCGRDSVFLASGVSGGATGLAMMASSPDPYADMAQLSGQKALSAAVEGMLSRDIVTANFGINVRTLDRSGTEAFPDRADLMEQTWEDQAPGLRRAFPAEQPLVPWHTVFNGTSVQGSCRVLVSDLDFGQGDRGCADAGNPVPGSYDLFGVHPCTQGCAPPRRRCWPPASPTSHHPGSSRRTATAAPWPIR